MNDFVPEKGRSIKGGSLSSNNGNGAGLPNGERVFVPGHASRWARVSAGRSVEAFSSTLKREDDLWRMPTWKRLLDLACILLTFSIWLPLMFLLMIWIAAFSPGPVFYRQQRIGHRGRSFMIFKFRTMRVNAETKTHAEYFAHLMQSDCAMTKLDAEGDPRLIRGGRFLRASGLDELPQIFNVIWGDMSLVGPRPCLPGEFERYTLPQRKRFDAVPGLTGYWQVNGKNRTTFSEMIAMDIFYARNMTLWLDCKIILKTIPALIEQTLESQKSVRNNQMRIPTRIALGGPEKR